MLNLNNIKFLFKHSYIEINENHNEAYTAYNNYLKKTNKKIQILVNFDTHSDLFQNYNIHNSVIDIANWVNYCIKEFNIEQFYWVIPDYIYNNSKYRNIYEKKANLIFNSPFHVFDDENINLAKVNMKELYFNMKTGEILTGQRINTLASNCKLFNMPFVIEKTPNLKKIHIFIITKQNLKILKDKEIFLSVDADYFCNSGFDTINQINNKYITVEDLTNSFNGFIESLVQAKINISCASLTFSPIYVPKKLRPEFETFFKTIKESSN